MKDKQALVGQWFGDLEVLEYQGVVKKTRHLWWCHCNCGEELAVREDHLKSGHTTTCGCRGFPKGVSRNGPEYRTWANIIQRCTNPKVETYCYYGARGIQVCQRWRESFKNFYEDMGPRPLGNFSIERKEHTGNYEPDNCVWADRFTQANNKSNNVNVTFEGRTQSSQQWANELGMRAQTIRDRLAKGLSTEEVLNAFRLDEKPIEFNDKIQSVADWAKELDISPYTIRQRRWKGLPVEVVLQQDNLIGLRIEYKGKVYTVEELSKLSGLKPATIRQRLRLNMTAEEIVELPNNNWIVRRFLKAKKN